ncbi:Cam1p [Sugiyamaella lignohabitans]|uniref:Cam1p n=1 Tax=Sugiyamaella lignohabitans TaxID=796027 RepID=A0A161HK62_9ASCO|nr:Cam1p [Sugiyamaella lignohabitans]ANB11968.1 Cam1p [Sugiyamaella lignohabitans]
MSFVNAHIIVSAAAAFRPLLGIDPYNKKNVDTALENLASFTAILESHLVKNTYLVGERVTVADIYAAGGIVSAFKNLFGAEWRKSHPAITRWFTTLLHTPYYAKDYANFEFIAEPVKYTPPKKEEKPKQEKKKEEAKPKAAADDEEDEAPKEKKAAHPLAALGNPKVPIDNWKRVYSNEDTREKALPWFFENYDAADYSLWKVAYKYNDELTLTFMSNNLIGGFFNRLSASTKYLFGAAVVYGENNNNGIVGAFLVRGQDYAPAFDVAPDWESYEYTKLDISKPEDKELLGDLWAWDKPLVINGEKREIADGKVFK